MAEQEKKFDLKGWATIIAAVAALITSVVSAVKPQDTSVTKNAYVTLSSSISKLSDAEQKNHEDIANLRGYLDGISRAPLLVPADPIGTHPSPVSTSPSATGPTMFAVSAPPVPTVHEATAPVTTPSFSSVAADAK